MLRNREAIIGRVRLQGDFFESLWRHYFAGAALVAVILVSGLSTPAFAQSCTGNQAPIANAGPDQSGQINVPVNFGSTGSSDADGTLTAYWWNFGDGQFTGWQPNSSMQHSFTAVGSYSVRLWVRDNCNVFSAVDTAIITISNSAPNPCNGNIAPIANAGPDKSGTVGQSISFSGSSSVDLNGNNTIASYIWNFGDGTANGNGVNVSHSFATAGNYNVTLTVTDNCNAAHTDPVAVSIIPANPCLNNLPPLADAGPNKTGTVGQAISLSGTASDVNNNLSSYSWNFGDGSALVSGQTASHIYASAGTYTATFSATDSCSAVGSDTATVTVSNPSGPCPTCPLQANFKVQKLVHVDLETGTETWRDIDLANDHLEIGLKHRLNASSSQGTITAYRWKKNGNTFSTQGPILLRDGYGVVGDETIELVVYGQGSTQSTTTSTIHLSPGMQSLGAQAHALIPILGTITQLGESELIDPSAYPALYHKTFYPAAVTILENKLWGLNYQQEAIVFADISDPANLATSSAVRIFPTGELDHSISASNNSGAAKYVPSMVSHNGNLYLAAYAKGVRIYRADKDNFGFVGEIPVSQIEGNTADFINKTGNALYVGNKGAKKIYVFSLLNPNAPILVTSITLNFTYPLDAMGGNDSACLGALTFDYAPSLRPFVQIIDVRNPLSPILVGSPIPLNSSSSTSRTCIASNNNRLVVLIGGLISIIRVYAAGSSLAAEFAGEISAGDPIFSPAFNVTNARTFCAPFLHVNETAAYAIVGVANYPGSEVLFKVNLMPGIPSVGDMKRVKASRGGAIFSVDNDGPLGPQDPVLFHSLPNLEIGAFDSD